MWRRCIARDLPARGALSPLRLERRAHLSQPHPAAGLAAARVVGESAQGGAHPRELLLRVGLVADYRGTFWRMALPLLRQGRIEDVIRVGLVAHHLITFARDGGAGRAERLVLLDETVAARGARWRPDVAAGQRA